MDEWLDFVMGVAGDILDDIIALVNARFENTRDILSAQFSPVEPMYRQAAEGHPIAKVWCDGFMMAVNLRSDKWDAFGQSKEGSKLMLPVK